MINWNKYFNSKYHFLREQGRTDDEIINIFKKNLNDHRHSKDRWKTRRDQFEINLLIMTLDKFIKNKEDDLYVKK